MTITQLASEAKLIGLDGLALVEHDKPWDLNELERLSQKHGVVFIPAREVQTEVGHITAFGLGNDSWNISKIEHLRDEVNKCGGYLVSAHPFRYLNDTSKIRRSFLLEDPTNRPASAEEASAYNVFKFVDAIEVFNAQNDSNENIMGWETAKILNKPMIGGSDVHRKGQLGNGTTFFYEKIDGLKTFMAALKRGRFYPSTGLKTGKLRRYPESERVNA
ncbi:MAG: PHP-associated [Chloroflexi bacterium]|jgi:predicted metal-dependent phosphoesterase TrpH|nr:MAG: PHP-associated [Chloroflexota bacterium]